MTDIILNKKFILSIIFNIILNKHLQRALFFNKIYKNTIFDIIIIIIIIIIINKNMRQTLF